MRSNLNVVAKQVKLGVLLGRPVDALQGRQRDGLAIDCEQQIAFRFFQCKELSNGNRGPFFWRREFPLNGASVCGKTDWLVNTAADVTTATCDGGRANNAVEYDIVKVDSATMTFGKVGDAGASTDGSSDAKRPNALGVEVFTKS